MEEERRKLTKDLVTFIGIQIVSKRFTIHCQVCLITELKSTKLKLHNQNESYMN